MGWLVSYTIASMVGAFFVVRVFDYLVSGVSSRVADVGRFFLFVGTWTAITTGSGLRDFTNRVHGLRQRSRDMRVGIDAIADGKRKP